MNAKLQDAALDAIGLISNTQWDIAFVARYGNADFAAKAIENLRRAAAELQAALDEVKEC